MKDESSQKVFLIAGYLAPNTPIPLEIFQKTLELNDRDLRKAKHRLTSLGLLSEPNELPNIHPLLAGYSRTLSSKEMLEKLAKKLAGLARQANKQVDRTGNLDWFVLLRPACAGRG